MAKKREFNLTEDLAISNNLTNRPNDNIDLTKTKIYYKIISNNNYLTDQELELFNGLEKKIFTVRSIRKILYTLDLLISSPSITYLDPIIINNGINILFKANYEFGFNNFNNVILKLDDKLKVVFDYEFRKLNRDGLIKFILTKHGKIDIKFNFKDLERYIVTNYFLQSDQVVKQRKKNIKARKDAILQSKDVIEIDLVKKVKKQTVNS